MECAVCPDVSPHRRSGVSSLQVAVGGTASFFPDGAGGKPWTNADPHAVNAFWAARNQWSLHDAPHAHAQGHAATRHGSPKRTLLIVATALNMCSHDVAHLSGSPRGRMTKLPCRSIGCTSTHDRIGSLQLSPAPDWTRADETTTTSWTHISSLSRDRYHRHACFRTHKRSPRRPASQAISVTSRLGQFINLSTFFSRSQLEIDFAIHSMYYCMLV